MKLSQSRPRESGQILIFAVLILVPLALAGLQALVKTEARLEITDVHGEARAQAVAEAARRAGVLNRIAANNRAAAEVLKKSAEVVLRATSDGMVDAFLTSSYADWPPEVGSKERRALDSRWRSAGRQVGLLKEKLARLERDNLRALRSINCPACEATLVQVDAGLGLCVIMGLHPDWFEKDYAGPARSAGATILAKTPVYDPRVSLRLDGKPFPGQEPARASRLIDRVVERIQALPLVPPFSKTASARAGGSRSGKGFSPKLPPCSLHSAHGTAVFFDLQGVLKASGMEVAFRLPRPMPSRDFEQAWELSRSAEAPLRSRRHSLARLQESLLKVIAKTRPTAALRSSAGPVTFIAKILHPALDADARGDALVRAGFDPRFVAALWIPGAMP